MTSRLRRPPPIHLRSATDSRWSICGRREGDLGPGSPFGVTQSDAVTCCWCLLKLAALVEAAEVRGVQEYARSNPSASAETLEAIRSRGLERSVLFLVAAFTGLRRGEILRLRWCDVAGGSEPALIVRPEIAKNRRSARIELPSWLGQVLKQQRARAAARAGRLPAERDQVFAISYRHVTERLKLDAVFANIGRWDETRSRVVTDDGRVIDFHALRGTCATLLDEAGIGPKAMKEHMRHSDLRLTLDVYVQARRELMRAAVEKLGRPAPVDTPAASGHALARIDSKAFDADEARRAGS